MKVTFTALGETGTHVGTCEVHLENGVATLGHEFVERVLASEDYQEWKDSLPDHEFLSLTLEWPGFQMTITEIP